MLERPFESKDSLPTFLKSLSEICTVEKDRFVQEAYILRFDLEGVKTTVRIVFNDPQSRTDMIITNMTTLPDSEKGKGYGSSAIKKLLEWAHANQLKNIHAVQVQRNSESFWTKNGFEKLNNATNDFKYISPE